MSARKIDSSGLIGRSAGRSTGAGAVSRLRTGLGLTFGALARLVPERGRRRGLSPAAASGAAGDAELEMLADVARRSSNAIILTDLDDRIVWVNDAFVRITRIKAPQAVGEPLALLFPEAGRDSKGATRQLEAAPHRLRGTIPRRAGPACSLEAEVSPRFSPDGAHIGFVVVATEVSVRMLESVVESETTGYWDWDVAADTQHYSPCWLRMLGYAPGELPATPGTWRDLIHASDLPRVEAELHAHLESAESIRPLVRGNGG